MTGYPTSFSATPAVLITLFNSGPLGWVIAAVAVIGIATVLTSIANAAAACLSMLRHHGDRASAPPPISVPGEDALLAIVHGDDVPALIADALDQGAKLWGAGARMGAGEAQDIRTAISRDGGAFVARVTVYRIGGDA
jgi:hypothetical protein